MKTFSADQRKRKSVERFFAIGIFFLSRKLIGKIEIPLGWFNFFPALWKTSGTNIWPISSSIWYVKLASDFVDFYRSFAQRSRMILSIRSMRRTENFFIFTVRKKIKRFLVSSRILVLSDGSVAEFDRPQILASNPNSAFSKLLLDANINSNEIPSWNEKYFFFLCFFLPKENLFLLFLPKLMTMIFIFWCHVFPRDLMVNKFEFFPKELIKRKLFSPIRVELKIFEIFSN